MICVAATTKTDAKAGFSNFGATHVHLGAPGAQILSTVPTNAFAYFDGTSMATPHVAGVAALIAAQFPGISASDIKCKILQNVDPIPALAGITVTGGRLNAAKALANPCTTASITGNITINGTGQNGKTVQLKGTALTTTTDVNGNFTFSGVPNGTFKVKIMNLSGAGTYSGNVSVNGVGEVGKKVKIKGVAGTVLTDGSGNYSKSGVPAGSHNVTIKNVDVP
jgi:subtilisin family serine protease